MNAREFSTAMGKVSDKYVNEAINYNRKRKRSRWVKWSAIAAGVVIVISITSAIVPIINFQKIKRGKDTAEMSSMPTAATEETNSTNDEPRIILHYKQVAPYAPAETPYDDVYSVEIPLTELVGIAPDIEPILSDITGCSAYYLTGHNTDICYLRLTLNSVRRKQTITTTLYSKDIDPYSDQMGSVPDNLGDSTVDQIEVAAYERIFGNRTELYVEFCRDDILYRISTLCDEDEHKLASDELIEIVKCYVYSTSKPAIHFYTPYE